MAVQQQSLNTPTIRQINQSAYRLADEYCSSPMVLTSRPGSPWTSSSYYRTRDWNTQVRTPDGRYEKTLAYNDTWVRRVGTDVDFILFPNMNSCYGTPQKGKQGWEKVSFRNVVGREDEVFPLELRNSVPALLNSAKLDLANKIKDQKSQIMVSIWEAHKTLDTIASLAKRIARSFEYMRKGQWSRAYHYLTGKPGTKMRTAASAWLEYRMAVRTTLLDAKGIAEQLADLHFGELGFPIKRRSKKITKLLKTSLTSSWGPGYNSYGAWPRVLTRGTSTHEVRVGCWATVELKPENEALKQANEWGLQNPLETMWELTGFSWLVDYFLHIGEFIESLTSYSFLEFLDAGYDWVYMTDSQYVYQVDTVGWKQQGTGLSTVQYREYHRRPFNDFQELMPEWRGFEPKLNLGRYLDILSLLANATGGDSASLSKYKR